MLSHFSCIKCRVTIYAIAVLLSMLFAISQFWMSAVNTVLLTVVIRAILENFEMFAT